MAAEIVESLKTTLGEFKAIYEELVREGRIKMTVGKDRDIVSLSVIGR